MFDQEFSQLVQQETEETCNQNILQNMKLIVPYS